MELIDEIKSAAKEAGKIMKDAARPKIMEKSGHANFVTETDEKIQKYLMDSLSGILPEAAFLGEEDGQDVFTKKMEHGFVFVIDPIDGTSNFI
ncbi:MAG: inositol monophosphatase, partial [Lachnospiraceae bacterium]|nr:inositol monophosphatase [Lachnospiraceae bacterium]